MSKLSPGPWKADDMGEIEDVNGVWIASTAERFPDNYRETGDHAHWKQTWANNAAAIAKVPEMVELLRTLGEQFEEWQEEGLGADLVDEDGTDPRAYWRARIDALLKGVP